MTTTNHAEVSSLYDRLGGADGISKLVDDIVAAHMSNPAVKSRFLPYQDEPDKLAATKHHLCTFLGAGTGGPEQYEGRSMPETHRGMNISEAEYMAVLDDILNAMRGNGIDEATQNDILAIAYSLKDEILHV